MLEPRRKSGGIRTGHGVLVVAGVVALAIVAYMIVGFVLGLVGRVIEIAVIVVIVAAIIHFMRRGRRRREY